MNNIRIISFKIQIFIHMLNKCIGRNRMYMKFKTLNDVKNFPSISAKKQMTILKGLKELHYVYYGKYI